MIYLATEKYGDFNFKRSCLANPEQYDVFFKKKLIGYVRLRFGKLTLDYIGGSFKNKENIYTVKYGNELTGSFLNISDRKRYIKEMINSLENHMKRFENKS